MLKQVLDLISLPLAAEGSVEQATTRRLLPLMMVPLSLFIGLLSGVAIYKNAWSYGITLLIGTGLVTIIAFQSWRKNIRNGDQPQESAYFISRLIYIAAFIIGMSMPLFLMTH